MQIRDIVLVIGKSGLRMRLGRTFHARSAPDQVVEIHELDMASRALESSDIAIDTLVDASQVFIVFRVRWIELGFCDGKQARQRVGYEVVLSHLCPVEPVDDRAGTYKNNRCPPGSSSAAANDIGSVECGMGEFPRPGYLTEPLAPRLDPLAVQYLHV